MVFASVNRRLPDTVGLTRANDENIWQVIVQNTVQFENLSDSSISGFFSPRCLEDTHNKPNERILPSMCPSISTWGLFTLESVCYIVPATECCKKRIFCVLVACRWNFMCEGAFNQHSDHACATEYSYHTEPLEFNGFSRWIFGPVFL